MRIPAYAVPLLFALFGGCAPALCAAQEQSAGGAPQPATQPPAEPVAPPLVVQPVQEPAPPANPPPAPPLVVEPTQPPAPPPAPEPAPHSGPLPNQQATPQQPANDQVIDPQLERRQVKVPHIPSNNFEFGVFGGVYDTESFGTNAVGGARFGYHITEDVFIEAVYGQTKVSDSTFRLFLPGGIFPNPEETLRYYDLSAGYNILPGEFFIGRTHAKVAALYVIAGLGTTKFDGASHETVNVGFGTRLFLADWVALQVDMRDHVFSFDILGTRKDEQNLELTAGITFFF